MRILLFAACLFTLLLTGCIPLTQYHTWKKNLNEHRIKNFYVRNRNDLYDAVYLFTKIYKKSTVTSIRLERKRDIILVDIRDHEHKFLYYFTVPDFTLDKSKLADGRCDSCSIDELEKSAALYALQQGQLCSVLSDPELTDVFRLFLKLGPPDLKVNDAGVSLFVNKSENGIRWFGHYRSFLCYSSADFKGPPFHGYSAHLDSNVYMIEMRIHNPATTLPSKAVH